MQFTQIKISVSPDEISSAYSPAGALLVSGAGETACNGIFHPNGQANGKASYLSQDNPDVSLSWSGSQWGVILSGATLYFSEDDVATPDLVTTWEIGEVAGDPEASVIVANCYDPGADGEYSFEEINEGRPAYSWSAYYLSWVNGYWSIANGDNFKLAVSSSDVATPDLAEDWESYSVTVAGAGASEVNQQFFHVTLEDYPTYVGASLDVYIYRTYNETREQDEWWIEVEGENSPFYYSAEDVPHPFQVTTWLVDLGDAPAPTVTRDSLSTITVSVPTTPSEEPVPDVDAYANLPEGYALAADGSGGTSFVPPPAAFPTIVVSADWENGDPAAAVADILAGLGLEHPPNSGEVTSFSLSFTVRGEHNNWRSLKSYMDYGSIVAEWMGRAHEPWPVAGEAVIVFSLGYDFS